MSNLPELPVMPPLPFEGIIEGYATKYVHRHHWRVSSTMEFGDCMQEAYLVYRRVARLYPHTEAKHFMALFKVALMNEMNTLSIKDAKEREHMEPINASVVEETCEGGGDFLVAIRQAPAEVKSLLSLIFNAPQEIADMALASWKPRRNRPSEKICRLLGLDEDLDVMALTRDYFGI